MTLFRQRNDYLVCQHLTVGQGLPWLGYYARVMEIEKVAFRLLSPTFRELVHRLLNHAQTILDSGNLRLLRFEIETSRDWRALPEFEDEDSYDDVVLALDELLSVTS
jgi:hypothetical protein